MKEGLIVVIVVLAVASLRPFEHLKGSTTSVVATTVVSVGRAEALLAGYDATLELDRDAAQAWGFDEGSYPVMWMLNNMTCLYTTPIDIIPGLISQYYEFIAMLPFVRLHNPTKTSTIAGGTSIQLYLNNEWAVLGGRLYYGMPKTRAVVDWSARDIFMASTKTPLIRADMHIDRRHTHSYAEFRGAMPLWEHFMSRPIIQSAPFSSAHFCCTMPVDWARARFSRASLNLTIASKAVTGLPEGASFSISPTPNPSPRTNLGAFYLLGANWSLSPPWTYCF